MTEKTEKMARQIGAMIAQLGAVLVCGGLDGVMMAACRGAKEAGGMTIGILPGKNKKDANPCIDIALPPSIGFARQSKAFLGRRLSGVAEHTKYSVKPDTRLRHKIRMALVVKKFYTTMCTI